MEMHQVRYFLAVCREQSFTRAAKRCGVSQPSLSSAIKRLEEEFGGPLFQRGPARTVLSALGCVVQPHFEQLERTVRQARRKVARFNRSPQNRNDRNNGGLHAQVAFRRRDRARHTGRDDLLTGT